MDSLGLQGTNLFFVTDKVGEPTPALLSYPTFADLPPATEGLNAVVLVATGIPFVNGKPAGLYQYSGSSWSYIGETPELYFRDNVGVFYDDANPSKKAMLELSGITPGTTRTLTIPDKSGILATLS